ncbi:MAG: T9SS type A sorting domain-containing protein [Salibacter sp.]|uniref:T9SS type A sorting domain-containing protein n=1 Tax=Salibacter sp. TaxID=2010995 RepID=UPI0028704A38|nr:T9SS type A sorting domain-containing protein [Salibacter sp.]MDR9399097.1 T9SS type A sorting domain-containing protein [Salibacter sp.]
MIIIQFLLVLLANGQSRTQLSRFNVNELSGKVTINWTLSKGSTCFGIEVQHTTDTSDLKPKVIHKIGGVCGDQNFEVSYNYTHLSPVPNQRNYYRLVLGTTPTEYESVYYQDFHNRKTYISPNPAKGQTEIKFDNEKSKQVSVKLISLNSIAVFEKIINRDNITINTTPFPPGLYLLKIKGDDFTYNEKLVISR